MNFLLRIKHWQLFMISWAMPIIIDIYAFTDSTLMLKAFPVMMLFILFGIFGWVWAIATGLHDKLPSGVKLNVGIFKVLFSIPITYLATIIIWMSYQFYGNPIGEGPDIDVVIILVAVFHLISMVCILLGFRFAAKTMKSVELGRLAKFGDYSVEFFFIWFSIFGMWILQPRLNKLMEEIDRQR